MERANIKVPRELFEELQAEKGSQTWESYLRENCLESHYNGLEELRHRLDTLPEKTADEIEQRLR